MDPRNILLGKLPSNLSESRKSREARVKGVLIEEEYRGGIRRYYVDEEGRPKYFFTPNTWSEEIIDSKGKRTQLFYSLTETGADPFGDGIVVQKIFTTSRGEDQGFETTYSDKKTTVIQTYKKRFDPVQESYTISDGKRFSSFRFRNWKLGADVFSESQTVIKRKELVNDNPEKTVTRRKNGLKDTFNNTPGVQYYNHKGEIIKEFYYHNDSLSSYQGKASVVKYIRGVRSQEIWYNESKRLHREGAPAIINYDESLRIISAFYYLNGKQQPGAV